MIGRNLLGFSYETVAIICHIMLDVSAASLSDLEFRGVWVRRPEICNSQGVSGIGRVVLNQKNGTA